jgi:hypothetical protein
MTPEQVAEIHTLAHNLEIVIMVLKIVALPLLMWCFATTWLLRGINSDATELLKMHRSPESFGFGTNETNRIIEEGQREMIAAARAINDSVKILAHYTKWLSEHTTGQVPPPPAPDGIL